MKIAAIVLAGGKGTRMNSDKKKQYLKLDNKPIFMLSLKKLLSIEKILEYILVIPEEDKEYINNVLKLNNIENVKIAHAGCRRQDSVFNGLKMVENSEKVLIHDSVRPFFSYELLYSGIKKLKEYDAVIPGIPVKDTIKKVVNKTVEKTLDRSNLKAIQTPQFFDYKKLLELYHKHNNEKFTDDSYLFELKNIKVSIIMGLEENIKITTPLDYEIAKILVKKGKADV